MTHAALSLGSESAPATQVGLQPEHAQSGEHEACTAGAVMPGSPTQLASSPQTPQPAAMVTLLARFTPWSPPQWAASW